MKKLFILLLIPVLFLSGCIGTSGEYQTIDANGNLVTSTLSTQINNTTTTQILSNSINSSTTTTFTGLLKAIGGFITSITAPTGNLVGDNDSQELTHKTLNASIGKGTWTTSGTWALPAFSMNGALVMNQQSILKLFELQADTTADINISHPDYGKTTRLYGGTTDAGSGSVIITRGYNGANGGEFLIYTANSDKNSNIKRLWITGSIDTAKVTFASCNVSIGGQSGHLLDMESSGGGYYDATLHAFVDVSSAVEKENIRVIPDCLTIVNQLNPIMYDWKKYIPPIFEKIKDPDSVNGFTEGKMITQSYWVTGGAKNQYGLIADDVAKISPQLVSFTCDNATGLNTNALIAILVKAVQQQDIEINQMKKQIEILNEKVGIK